MIEELDHIGIVVENLDTCLERYERVFHIKPNRVETLQEHGVRVAFLPVGKTMIELVQPLVRGKGMVGEFLEKHGEGFNHVAYRVNKLEDTMAEMKNAGVLINDVVPIKGVPGTRFVRLSPEENNNVPIHLLERDQNLK